MQEALLLNFEGKIKFFSDKITFVGKSEEQWPNVMNLKDFNLNQIFMHGIIDPTSF